MKKLLIISPYFAPSNAADTHRIRTSLPYFEQFGWLPEIVCVDEKHSDMNKDELLNLTIPDHIKIHKVKALSKRITSKIGLGSIALRSILFYKNYINRLLKKEKFDLIYFSTTQFPVCILGNYWKKKFGVPYVIDVQDPWHTDYYQHKPKSERPKKYWFSYHLNKWLEPIAMKSVDGLISVSPNYIDTLKDRYANLKDKPVAVIPFGSHQIDFNIAEQHIKTNPSEIKLDKINIVYIGAVGNIMNKSIDYLCEQLLHIKNNNIEIFDLLNISFIGTSYAPLGEGVKTVLPIAEKYGVEKIITEKPNRIGYFESLNILNRANILLILGSDDQAYNPSKIFTYALAKKPVIGIFKSNSPAIQLLRQYCEGIVLDYEMENAKNNLEIFLKLSLENRHLGLKKSHIFNFNKAKEFTEMQCILFNQLINERN